MRTARVRMESLKHEKLRIGHTGENLAQCVEIDVSDWITEYPSGVISLWVQRSGDKFCYPAQTEVVGGVLKWTVTAADTGVEGPIGIEVRVTDGDTVAKSDRATVYAAGSLDGSEAAMPEGVRTWTDAANAAAGAASDAAGAANQAAQSAQEAAQAANQAAALMDIRKYAPAFKATGNPVTCWPVEGTELGVRVTVDGSEGQSVRVRRCGKNLLDDGKLRDYAQ